MALWIATPVDEGFHAYQMGALACECPHPPGTTDAAKWKYGWQRAKVKLGPAETFAARAFCGER